MQILTEEQIKSILNLNYSSSFDGGDLFSHSGLLPIKEFAHKFGFHKHVSNFKTDDKTRCRHTDVQNLCYMIYQIIACYFEDNDTDVFTNEPIFTNIIFKKTLTSQPTLSRFWNRMNDETLPRFDDIIKVTSKGFVYPFSGKPKPSWM